MREGKVNSYRNSYLHNYMALLSLITHYENKRIDDKNLKNFLKIE